MILLSWLFYYLGDGACKIMTLLDQIEWWVNFWYPIYNWFMIKSVDFQAKNPRGPWQ